MATIPRTMTLAAIEMRLKVFPQYLEYRIDYMAYTGITTLNYRIRRNFPKPNIFCWWEKPPRLLSFDEWLVYNYSNLIL